MDPENGTKIKIKVGQFLKVIFLHFISQKQKEKKSYNSYFYVDCFGLVSLGFLIYCLILKAFQPIEGYFMNRG